MKYCKVIWLSSGRADCPANDHTLFTSAPSVQCPGCSSATTEGPMLHFPWPKTELVAVGSTKAGPAPQINLPGFAGDRKNVGFRSPNPKAPWLTGWLTVG